MFEHPSFGGLQLGDLVNFKTKDYLDALSKITLETGTSTHVIKQGRKDHLPPTMVVVELSRLNPRTAKLYDPDTGNKIKDEVQVKCLWYAKVKGKEGFHERWFNRLVLEPISEYEEVEVRTFALNQVVTLRTYLAAEYEITNSLNISQEATPNGDYTLRYEFETGTASFFPPKMVITAFGKQNEENRVYSEFSEKLPTKWLPSREIKCMWYESDSGKFIEKFLPVEALVSAEPGERPTSRLEDYIKRYLDSPSDDSNGEDDSSDS